MASGRFGAILAPFVMGLLLDLMLGPQAVVLMLIPATLAAAAAALWVARREPVAS